MSYRRFMTLCVVCVLCVKELDRADLQPEGANCISTSKTSCELKDKLVVFTN
jgi:hypothetical protein